MEFQEFQRNSGMGNRGDHRIMYYRVITAIPQAPGAIANPGGNYRPLGVNRAMPLSVGAAVPRRREPLQNIEKAVFTEW